MYLKLLVNILFAGLSFIALNQHLIRSKAINDKRLLLSKSLNIKGYNISHLYANTPRNLTLRIVHKKQQNHIAHIQALWP